MDDLENKHLFFVYISKEVHKKSHLLAFPFISVVVAWLQQEHPGYVPIV